MLLWYLQLIWNYYRQIMRDVRILLSVSYSVVMKCLLWNHYAATDELINLNFTVNTCWIYISGVNINILSTLIVLYRPSTLNPFENKVGVSNKTDENTSFFRFRRLELNISENDVDLLTCCQAWRKSPKREICKTIEYIPIELILAKCNRNL